MHGDSRQWRLADCSSAGAPGPWVRRYAAARGRIRARSFARFSPAGAFSGETTTRAFTACDALSALTFTDAQLVSAGGREREGTGSGTAGDADFRSWLAGEDDAVSASIAARVAGRCSHGASVERPTEPSTTVAMTHPASRSRPGDCWWRWNYCRASTQASDGLTMKRTACDLYWRWNDIGAAKSANRSAIR